MELVTSRAKETSPAKQPALPDAWVVRLFERFAAMYGRHWLELWNGVPMESVVAAWGSDLAGFSGEQIKRALDHCKANNKFPPTLPEFVGLCRQFRVEPAHQAYLPAPRGELPEQAAEIIAQLQPTPGRDSLQWARDILQRHGEGIVYPFVSLQFAREALGVH